MATRPQEYSHIYNTIDKVESYWNGFKPTSTLNISYQEKWLLLAPFFETISLQNRACITLWDAATNQFIYAVDKTKVLGQNACHFTKEDGVDFTMANIHPHYLQAFLIIQQTGIQYCFDHTSFLPFEIILHADFLYKKISSYIHVVQQVSIVETDINNQPLLYLSYLYDITHLKKQPSANLIVTTPADIMIWNYSFDKKHMEKVKRLTLQEKNILSLLGEGKHTMEIADMLSISPHTVDTHRRHLLAKTNCVDTTALVTYSRMVGLM